MATLEDRAKYAQVLIESDWNLKTTLQLKITGRLQRINRIRLEFKAIGHRITHRQNSSINRIRLEFKDKMGTNIQDIQNAY